MFGRIHILSPLISSKGRLRTVTLIGSAGLEKPHLGRRNCISAMGNGNVNPLWRIGIFIGWFLSSDAI
jgi:hypothetical protein